MRYIYLLLLLPGLCSAQFLETKGSVRASVFRQAELTELGTSQMTIAMVDSQIQESYGLFGCHTKFDVVPLAYWDTFSAVAGQGLYDAVLNSDFVEGGLIRCKKELLDGPSASLVQQVVPIGPNQDMVTVKPGEAPKYVWASSGIFEVYPVPTGEQSYLKFYFQYQAQPPALTSDTSSILIKPSLRAMLVDHICLRISEKLEWYDKAAAFRSRLPSSLTQRTAIEEAMLR